MTDPAHSTTTPKTLRVALAQLNLTVGDIAGNCALIAAAAREARAQGARLLVTPELAVCGYPPQDLLAQRRFAAECETAALKLGAEEARDGLAILIGCPIAGDEGPAGWKDETPRDMSLEAHPGAAPTGKGGKRLYNGAILLENGRVAGVAAKRLLPTYDVFDEARWFQPADGEAPPLLLDGVKLGVHICEDGWADAEFWGGPAYASDPAAELAAGGAEVLINLSASPWSVRRGEFRTRMMAATCRRHGLAGVMVNLVGGNDDLIFDGSSFALDAGGAVLAALPGFESKIVVVDVPLGRAAPREPRTNPDTNALVLESLGHAWPAADVAAALELGVRDYCRKTGFKEVLIGLSGGIDSSVAACIAAKALGPERVRGVAMPSQFSSAGSVTDARELAQRLGIRFDVLPITRGFDTAMLDLAPFFEGTPFGLAEENTQARLRGLLLMALSNKTGALVLACGNKSELAVGYATLYGDMCGGLEVVGDVYKTHIYRLAAHCNGGVAGASADTGPIPRVIIEKAPSAELRPNQTDQDTLPPYEVLDQILEAHIERRMSRAQILRFAHDDEATVDRVLKLVDRSEYKRRQAPPVLRVSPRAFGRGRAMPIARG
jgi:NAD+ synthase (glutamine-hydrolysing)